MIAMNYILLAVGSVLSLLFVFMLIKGQKYNYMIDALEGDDFPLKTIYCAGLALQDIKVFRPFGKVASYLRENTKLVYSRKFSEFYTRIIWAQALSFGIMCCCVCFLLTALLPDMSGLLALMGIVMLILPGYYFVSHVGELVQKRRDACDEEFPNAIAKLALIVNSGVILHDSWEVVAHGNTGEFYDLMQKSCLEMQNGKSDIDAIYEFGIQSGSDTVKKFTSALIQSIERGGGELPSFLSNQSKELWQHRRQVMLQKGEKAVGALLMPIALMFLGVMLIVISAAMQSFSL